MAKLRERIGKRVLKRKKRGFKREIRVHNFDTAKSAVILFDTSDPESFPVIKDLRKFIESKGVNCSAFGYVHQKETPQEMLFRKKYSFITRSNINWYMKPGGEVVEAFYAQDPDLLIDLTLNFPLELQFLVQLSSARFKIGCFTEEENDYDLMINLTGRCDAGFLAEQIRHYVSMIIPAN
jgi:hypothetical protein